jgi:hypothetical protein
VMKLGDLPIIAETSCWVRPAFSRAVTRRSKRMSYASWNWAVLDFRDFRVSADSRLLTDDSLLN